MIYGDYEIFHYHPNMIDQVAKVIKYLWGGKRDFRIDHLKWKHYENPYSNFPHGIVALYNREVVGFRGYSPMKWRVKGQEFKTLIAGDTVVDQKHRMKGLSVAMGQAANKYQSNYKFLLNFTSGGTSTPGYLKLGFRKFLEKSYYTRRAFKEDIEIKGDFSGVLFFEIPDLKKICDLILKEDNFDKITPVRTEEYFQWKMRNSKNKYLFFGYKDRSYVIFSTQPNGNNGYIVDYVVENVEDLDNILRFILKTKPFNFTMVYNYGVCNKLSKVLKGLNFEESSMTWHLLIRPVKKDFSERDWFVEGVDTRKIENWNMRAICSDDA